MADSQRDVKNRIASVKNIEKITRAMEMVAAARLRRAEQRIEALRPYANAIRRMTRQAAEAADNMPNLPVLQEHESVDKVGVLLVTGDRGLAGAFNSQILRAGLRAGTEFEGEGKTVRWYASGRRGVSSLTFRGRDILGAYTGFTDRPAYANAREIADDFGFDLDEDGQPMDEGGDSDRVKSRDEDQDEDSRDGDSSNGARASSDDDSDEKDEESKEEAGATA